MPRKLQELIPNSELEFFEGCIHAPYFEDSERFNARHLEFLLKNVTCMSLDIYPVREETLLRLSDATGGDETQVVTAQNFAVELWQPSNAARLERAGQFESMVILTEGNARVQADGDCR